MQTRKSNNLRCALQSVWAKTIRISRNIILSVAYVRSYRQLPSQFASLSKKQNILNSSSRHVSSRTHACRIQSVGIEMRADTSEVLRVRLWINVIKKLSIQEYRQKNNRGDVRMAGLCLVQRAVVKFMYCPLSQKLPFTFLQRRQ